MKAGKWVVASLGLVLALLGCEAIPSRPPGSSFYAARLQDCKSGAPIPSCETFKPGEVPAIVFINYAGRTLTVRVNNETTGAISWNKTDYIPQDRTVVWWSLGGLPAGTYKAEMLLGGTFIQSYTFNILPPVPRRR